MIEFNPKIAVTAVTNTVIDGLAGLVDRSERQLEPVQFGRFPGGEVYIKSNFIDEFRLGNEVIADVQATLSGSMDELAALALVIDALRRQFPGILLDKLYLGYVPYGRQDRVGNDPVNASLSIRMVTDFINQMEFSQVFVDHPHSTVTTALINNANDATSLKFFMEQIERISQDYCIKSEVPGKGSVGVSRTEVGIVSPDAGSLKFTDHFLQEVEGRGLGVSIKKAGVGFKVRDMRTGDITGTRVLDFDPDLEHYFILDDICDGGRTFTELANAIRGSHTGEPTIHLIVTHGIFSKGLGVFKPTLDTVTAKVNYLNKAREPLHFNP